MTAFIFIALFLFTGSLFNVQASLRINEIYPAPAAEETEWVELYNDSDTEIDTAQFSITDAKQNKIILPVITVPPHEYVVATSSGVLNNSGGDGVTITGNDGTVVDTTNYSMDFSSGKSYAACLNDGVQWVVTDKISRLGPNDLACAPPTPTPTTTPSPVPTYTPSPSPIPTRANTPTPTIAQPRTYSNIYISEIMSFPETAANEWVEIYNNNDYTVDLVDWFIDDIESGGARPRSISMAIASHSYAIVEVPTALFNNDGDQVRLLDFDNRLIDSVSYSESIQGKSWGKQKYNEPGLCLQNPSRNTTNAPCIEVQNPTVTPQRAVFMNNDETISFTPTTTQLKILANSTADDVSTESANIVTPEWFFHPQTPTPDIVRMVASHSGQVLGAEDTKLPLPILPLTGTVSSVLTIISLLYKMKQGAAP